MPQKFPRAIRPAFKAIAMPREGFGDAGNILLLRNWNAYMHLVAEGTFKPEERGPVNAWARHCYELGKRSGFLSAAAVTTFVYGREQEQPHPSLREWRWRDKDIEVSYYFPASATDVRPDRQLAPQLCINKGNQIIADDASRFLLPGPWMGQVIDAAAYANQHLEKRRSEVFAKPPRNAG